MKVSFEQLFLNTTVANSTIYSPSQDFRSMLGEAAIINYTGSSLQGSIAPQYSIDNINWFDMPNSGHSAHHTIVAGGGSVTYHMIDLYYPHIRFRVTSTDADTATVTGVSFSKGV